MATRACDVLIVGARCAGAALAIYLARAGLRVIVLEAARLGEDHVLSTHTVHPAGMDVLDELGVGAAVRQHAPPARAIRFQVEGAWLDLLPPVGRDECCPRRYRLDGLLQDAAARAGADLRDRTRVTGVVREEGRVVGVRAEGSGGMTTLRAGVVVGADGRHSTVASLCDAEEYLGYDWPRGAYWAYWEPPAVWHSERFPYDAIMRYTGTARRFVFTTDDGHLVMGTMPVLAEARRWRAGGPADGYLADLRSDPVLAELVAAGTRVSPVIGTVGERCFFRQPVGPGWALVGDAGHHKDPLLGWGISEALTQARQLSHALVSGSAVALQRWWRQRDVDVLPRFRLGEDRGAPRALRAVTAVVLDRISEVPGLPARMFMETEYAVNPYDLMPGGRAATWALAAAVRGRPSLIGDLVWMHRRARAVRREVQARRALLDGVGSGAADRLAAHTSGRCGVRGSAAS